MMIQYQYPLDDIFQVYLFDSLLTFPRHWLQLRSKFLDAMGPGELPRRSMGSRELTRRSMGSPEPEWLLACGRIVSMGS